MAFWSDLNKYVLCESDFLCVFFLIGLWCMRKKGKLVSGFALSCHAFSRLLSMWGHCIMLFSLTLTSCMFPCKVWWEDALSSCGLSQPHKSLRRLYSSFFYPSDFLSFLHQSVISLRPWRATRPPRPKRGFYKKHVTNVQQIHFLSFFFCLRETHQEPLKLYEKYIFMFHLMFPACHVIARVPEAVGLLWIMLITYTFTF